MNGTPRIDPRTRQDIVGQIRALLPQYVPEWPWRPERPWPDDDPGAALVEIFARYMEIVIERLNRSMDKHFLAFLETIGVSPRPPAAARVPMQFFLSGGAQEDGIAPAGTPVSTAGAGPVAFETERELTVSRSLLKAIVTHDPDGDRLAVIEIPPGRMGPFAGDGLIGHILHLSQDTLLGPGRAARLEVAISFVDIPPERGDLLEGTSWWTQAGGGTTRLQPAIVLGMRLTGRVHTEGQLSTSLHGEGTQFTTELSTGDAVTIPGQGTRRVTGIGGNVSLTLSEPVNVPRPGLPIFRHPPISIAGTIHTMGTETTSLIGEGTHFTTDLSPGDSLLIPGIGTRRVQSVSGPAALTLDEPVNIPGPPGVAATRWPSSLTVYALIQDFVGAEPTKINGSDASWLWVKTEAPLRAGDRNRIRLTAAAAQTASGRPMPPDFAFADGQRLDVEKGGFLCFGVRPRENDAFYIACNDVFSRSGARIGLSVNVKFPMNPSAAVTPPTLAWEFWDGGAWQALGQSPTTSGGVAQAFSDTTNSFTIAGSGLITFTCPAIVEREVNGQMSRWVRVRILSGDYGTEPQLNTSTNTWSASTLRPPFLMSANLSYGYEAPVRFQRIVACNDFVYQAVPIQSAGSIAPFSPFRPSDEAGPALYLGFSDPFSNQGVRSFINAVPADQAPTNPTVAWEYWDGEAWANLGARDETLSLTQPGMIEFIGPVDLTHAERFGKGPLCWLRARLIAGEADRFAIDGIFPNAVWARQAVTITKEIVGSSAGRPDQVLRLSRNPVLAGQSIEIREGEAPSPEEIESLEKEGESDPVSIEEEQGARRVWVRWHEVDHFHLSGARDRHYALDHASGRIVFGDGRTGMIPPAGRNNVRATFRAGGGGAGNVPAGAITVLKRGLPFIDAVGNPLSAGGGADQEAGDALMVRGPLTLKHRDRAVSYEDFAWLAREASLQVARAVCLQARDAATAGTVRLLIVPDSADPEPMPSSGLIAQVTDYLERRRAPTALLRIESPAYVAVGVTAEVVPQNLDEAEEVRRRVEGGLERFLHPLKGGPAGHGWAFGRDIYVSEIAALIEGIDGVDHLNTVSLSGRAGDEDRTRERGSWVEVYEERGELVSSGVHRITLASA